MPTELEIPKYPSGSSTFNKWRKRPSQLASLSVWSVLPARERAVS